MKKSLKIRRTISCVLILCMLTGISASATEGIIEEAVSAKMSMPEQEEYGCESVEAEEIGVPLNTEYEIDEDEIMPSSSTFSENFDEELWSNIFSEQFGDDYIKNSVSEDRAEVTDATNKLIVEETDLMFPGKNGLDLKLTRRHDSQYDDGVCFAEMYENDRRYVIYMYVYSYTDTSNGQTVYIGFLSPNTMYEHMNEQVRISRYPTLQKTYTIVDTTETITFYSSDYIFNVRTNGDTGTLLVRNQDAPAIYAKTHEIDWVGLTGHRLLTDSARIGYDWNFLIPGGALSSTYFYRGNISNGVEREYDYVGAFRDFYGNVHMLNGTNYYIQYDKDANGVSRVDYKGTFNATQTNVFNITNTYTLTTHEKGFEYNFVIEDTKGLKYYLYRTGFQSINRLLIRGVEDKYGNIIQYQYDDSKLTKIIDTYEREINLEYNSENGTIARVSYTDETTNETRNITYGRETLPANTLGENEITEREVYRLSVTNANEETTIYDMREYLTIETPNIGGGEYLNSHPTEQCSMSKNFRYCIERIIYPSGAEKRYSYTMKNMGNGSRYVETGYCMVESEYDVVDGIVKNRKNYSVEMLKRYGCMCLKTTMTEPDADRVVYTEYNRYQLPDIVTTSKISTNKEYSSKNYGYDADYNIQYISEVVNYFPLEFDKYTYLSKSGGVLSSETFGQRKISYTYHIVDRKNTGLIKTKTYSDIQDNVDYIIRTTLTEDNKNIEYTQTEYSNTIVAKSKYEYDDENRVVCVKEWIEDTNADGEVNEDDEYKTVTADYTISNGEYTTTYTLSDICDADGQAVSPVTVTYKKDMYGNIIEKIDANGNSTDVEYDDVNRPIRYIYPDGTQQSVEYNINQMYQIFTERDNTKTKKQYDGMGNLIGEYREVDGEWVKHSEASYDANGRVAYNKVYSAPDIGIVNNYTYDILNRPLTVDAETLSGEELYSETYVYFVKNNTLQSQKNVSGGEIYVENIDSSGRLVAKSVSDGVNTYTTSYTYDKYGNLLTVKDPCQAVNSYEYDWRGNVTTATDAVGNITISAYDMLGRKTSDTNSFGDTANYTYDTLDRVIKTTAPFDNTTSSEKKTYYDGNSNVIKEAVKRGDNDYTVTEYLYNTVNSPVAVIGRNDGNDSVTQYEYDANGRMTAMITGLSEYSLSPTGKRTTYSYDTNGRLSATTDAMGNTESNTYDAYGNLMTATDRKGVATSYTYSHYGITSENTGGDAISYTYDSLGRVTERLYSNQTTAYTYDAFGRILTETEDNKTKQYSYDANSNVTQFVLEQDGEQIQSVSYEYDILGRLIKLTSGDTIFTYSYDVLGNLIQKQTGTQTTNYVYNKAHAVTMIENKNGTSLQSRYAYTYSPDGNRTSETTQGIGTVSYEYDRLGRLACETENTDGQNTSYNYGYDNAGNRITMTVRGGDNYSIGYTYDANNRLTGKVKTEGSKEEHIAYTYDNNGNMLSWTKSVHAPGTGNSSYTLTTDGTDFAIYRYDSRNRLKSYNNGVVRASYTYGADNLRRSKKVNGITTNFTWDGMNMVMEQTGTDTPAVHTYDVTGIAMSAKDGARSYYLKNAHGDVTAVTDQTGTIQTSNIYDAFGNTTDALSPFGYAGEYTDAETGMVYLRNRYYEPTIGRFISEDTHWNMSNMIYGDKEYKEGEIKTPDVTAILQSSNLYPYCINDPVNYVDPSGKGVGVIVGTAIAVSVATGLITGAIYASKEESFIAGFTNGFTSSLVTEVGVAIGIYTAHPYLGTMIGSIIGGAVGSLVEDIIFNRESKSKSQIVKTAAKSAAIGIISGGGATYAKYTISVANEFGSAARTLMKYDEEFGEILELFFGALSTAIEEGLQ